tara:strand:- start:1352 stop:2182 length:831 start_codon:yes stop_codon:yes gene_type:complete
MNKKNIDHTVVNEFGKEWQTYRQDKMFGKEQNKIFNNYFNIFPWDQISENSCGIDIGCGSGRWTKVIAPKVKHMHCIEPSDAIEIAKQNLDENKNISFYKTDIDNIPLNDNSIDFGFCLGVLHHLPDTENGMLNCVKKLKKGAPFLIYIYYNFDNRPKYYYLIWKISDYLRLVISKLPFFLKKNISFLLAAIIYYPLSRLHLFLKFLKINIKNFPLSAYSELSFYTMKTDAYDRFCTRLEKRYSRFQILRMMENSGLQNINFSKKEPYWCAVGIKK